MNSVSLPSIHLRERDIKSANAASSAAVRSSLQLAEIQLQKATDRLKSCLQSENDLDHDLSRLDLLRGQVGSQVVSTRFMSGHVLSDASTTANRISLAVKRLDVEQARVRSTLDVVDQVAELKACVLGVTGSMGAPQDWETAAGYLHRAAKIPKEIVHGSFAEEIVPTAEVPDPPHVTLDNAAESLRALFIREFERAAAEGNGGKVTRFFKLFPLIGKPAVGLDIYGRYICHGVASRARASMNSGSTGEESKDGRFYANALTRLFEHIAQIIEHHGGLVERHYGAGSMVKVIERLQLEADVQGGLLLDTWNEDRNIDRKLTDIRSYAFTFLVQSFLSVPTGRSTTPRPGPQAQRGTGSGEQAGTEESTDVKEIDNLVSEVALMLGRWSLYASFVASKCSHSGGASEGLHMPSVLKESLLHRKIEDRLVLPCNTMTTFFFRRSVEKAFQLDEQPPGLTLDHKVPIAGNPPYITSAVDDVMYVVNQVIERCLATSQTSVVTSVIPTIARILSSDFIGMIQRKMRDESYPKGAVQGVPPPEHTTIAFLVLVNNLDMAKDYTLRIVDSRLTGTSEFGIVSSIAKLYPLNGDAAVVSSKLRSLASSVTAKASELIRDGIFVVFQNIIKPRLRPMIAEAFRETDYQMTQGEVEEMIATAEIEGRHQHSSDNIVQESFRHGWQLVTKPLSRLLTERNWEQLLSLVASYLGEVLEKRIWSYYGRLEEVGGARLERDILAIVGLVVKGGNYSLREAFARPTQICLVMNMEVDEWEDMMNEGEADKGGQIKWQLDTEERLRARGIIRGRV